MGIYLNPGNALFKMDINSQIYVDKTGMIQHTNKLINSQQRYICVSRPRRFGKSMAANMLAAYYGKGCDSSELFDRFKISKLPGYREHLNQYNVIVLNIQNFLSLVPDVSGALDFLQDELLDELKEAYSEVLSPKVKFLSIALEKIYRQNGMPFIFIIDEWDCILRDKRYAVEEQNIYLDFIRNLFKDKAYVGLVYMTGILPIKKYGTHSALNMFIEYSMTDPRQFTEYVGFTENEVQNLCDNSTLSYEALREWYDGYTFLKENHIYSPKSVVEALLAERCSSYWTRTETYEALKIYMEMNFDGLKDSVIRMLAGEKIPVNTEKFQNDMTTFSSADDVLTLLIHLGYVAFDMEQSAVFIPNKEIRTEFKNAVEGANWKNVVKAIENSEALLRATWEKDEKKVADLLRIAHSEATSILTYNDENSLSCVIALAYFSAQNEYTRVRELPSGEGYADVVFVPRKHSDKPALLIELKYDKSVESALDQIKKKRYFAALEEYHGNLLLVGINYDKATKEHECKIETCSI